MHTPQSNWDSENQFAESFQNHDQFSLAEMAYSTDQCSVRVISSDNFTKRSCQTYPPQWMAREIVQNFVDANPDHPGTLDGVTVRREKLSRKKIRYTLTGNWPFTDYTGLVGLYSGKADQERTAGGNGIGLKQVALGFMRDYKVDRFQIDGEGWAVDYIVANADDVNRALAARGMNQTVNTGFLLSRATASPNRGSCCYTIETESPELINALDQIHTLGVSRQNPHLQDVDYENEHGAIKWLPIEGSKDQLDKKGNKYTQGRLYINGQIYRWHSEEDSRVSKKDKDTYWQGPEGITVNLKQLNYQISIDRPPMYGDELQRVMQDFIDAMPKAALIAELKSSEHLWSSVPYEGIAYNKVFCLSVVEMIVARLAALGFSKREYQTHFGDRKYYRFINRQQEEMEAIQDGYRICPRIFERIHMPHAEIKIKKAKVVEQNRESNQPSVEKEEMGKRLIEICKEFGLDIPVKEIRLKGMKELARFINEEILERGAIVKQVDDDPHTLHIEWKDAGHLSCKHVVQPTTRYRNEMERYMQNLRSIAQCGLSANNFAEFSIIMNGYTASFSVRGGGFSVHLTESESSERGLQIGFYNQTALREFKKLLGCKPGEDTVTKIIRRYEDDPGEIIKGVAKDAGKLLALVAALGLSAVGGVKCLSGSSGSGDFPSMSSLTNVNSWGNPFNGINLVSEDDDMNNLLYRYRNTGVTPDPRRGAPSSGYYSEVARPTKTNSHPIRNFNVIKNVTPEETKQIQLLVEYFTLTTGVEVKNSIFVFSGDGANGLNYDGRMIGLHYLLLNSRFETAVSTFTHEMAHNGTSGHGAHFRDKFAAMTSAREDVLGNTARTQRENRTENMKRILKIEAEWNQLIRDKKK